MQSYASLPTLILQEVRHPAISSDIGGLKSGTRDNDQSPIQNPEPGYFQNDPYPWMSTTFPPAQSLTGHGWNHYPL